MIKIILYGFIKNKTDKYFYIRDILMNILGIVEINGNIIVKYNYDAYGNLISVTGNTSLYNPFRYKGYYYDEETGLFWLSSRYYSPELGRFIQPADVSSLNPHSINGLNLYGYANNNPIGSANEGMLSGLGMNIMLSMFKLPVVNSNAGSSNYWNPHWDFRYF